MYNILVSTEDTNTTNYSPPNDSVKTSVTAVEMLSD